MFTVDSDLKVNVAAERVTRISDISNDVALIYGISLLYVKRICVRVKCGFSAAVVDNDIVSVAVMEFSRNDFTAVRRVNWRILRRGNINTHMEFLNAVKHAVSVRAAYAFVCDGNGPVELTADIFAVFLCGNLRKVFFKLRVKLFSAFMYSEYVL